jgi:hypothetical protein
MLQAHGGNGAFDTSLMRFITSRAASALFMSYHRGLLSDGKASISVPPSTPECKQLNDQGCFSYILPGELRVITYSGLEVLGFNSSENLNGSTSFVMANGHAYKLDFFPIQGYGRRENSCRCFDSQLICITNYNSDIILGISMCSVTVLINRMVLAAICKVQRQLRKMYCKYDLDGRIITERDDATQNHVSFDKEFIQLERRVHCERRT